MSEKLQPVPPSPFGPTSPYRQDTPEWHLYTHMQGALSLERTCIEDSNRYLARAQELREKAESFRIALEKLTGAA